MNTNTLSLKLFVGCAMMLFFANSYSQNITVTTTQTPTQLVNSLLGAGVSASNVTTNAMGVTQRGYFTGGSSLTPIPFLMDQGIILTSGSVTNVPGSNTSGMTSDNAAGGGDADLNAIVSGAGNETDDCAVLEFDFVPLSDTIAFSYIFASEEYPEFNCSDYNDVFAFFLSGPNPAGGSYTKKNLAVVSGTTIPVSVNTINSGVAGSNGNAANCSAINPNWTTLSYLYNDNPKNGNVIKIKCDGYTDVLVAGAKVVCGQTYHIKMAIGDVGYQGDTEWDSYVFIKAGSFASPGISTSLQVQDLNGNLSAGTTITEGCTKGVVTFTASPVPTTPYVVNYTITGTASNGTDYTNLSGSVTIPANAGTATILINPTADGIPDNNETVTISASNCAGSTTSTFTILDGAAPLVVNCGTKTTTSVQFTWNAITGATSYNYTYTVNGGTPVTSSTASTSLNITPLNPGDNVQITVTPVGSSCPVAATGNCTATNATCSVNAGTDQTICKGNSASLTAVGSGIGTPSYSWSSSPGVFSSAISNPSVSPTITTTYTVTVTYGTCTASDAVKVTVNSATAEAGTSPGIITCTNTSYTLTGSGGGTYSWAATLGGTITAGATSATPTINSGGTYNLTVTNNGCTAIDNVVVTENKIPPSADAGTSPGTITCTVLTLNLAGSGGGTYAWTATGGGNITAGGTTATPTINNGGTYNVIVTGANGCTASDFVVVNKNTTPPVAEAGTAPGILNCSVLTLNLAGSGGGSYNWAAAGGGNITSGGTTATPTINAAGTYTVTVTGANGCTAIDNVTITSNTTLPPADAGNSPGTITCTTTTLNLSGSGGGTYNWTATNGGNITAGGTTASPTINKGGTYNVTVTGANGCTASDFVVVTQNTTLPTAGAGNDVAICNGGSASLTATGGGTYKWTGGSTSNPITVSPTATSTYTVTVTTPANGCTAADDIKVTVNANPVVTIAAAPSTICNGQNTTLTANGGTSWSWSVGGSTSTISVSPTVNTTFIVTATDANNCSAQKSIAITVQPNITASATPDAICFGQTATITASGGATYKWSNNATTQSISVSPAVTTTYFVTVTDQACTETTSAVLIVNQLPQITPGLTQSICPGVSANISASTTSTIINPSYNWYPNSLTGTPTSGNPIPVSPAVSTTYIVVLTDDNGCSSSSQVAVTLNTVPTAFAGTDVAICNGGNTTLTATGGGTYQWSSGGNTNTINVSPIVTTTYTVTVTSGAGCTNADAVKVTVNTVPTANAGTDQTICAGTNASLTAQGGTTYLWSNNSANTIINVSPAITTTYILTAFQNGCSDTDDVLVTVNALPTPSIIATSTSVCTGQATDLTVSGGTTYLWSTNETATTIQVIPAANTTYTVTATSNGCTATDAIEITLNDDVTINTNNSKICIGNSATIGASGGSEYLWSNGDITSSITVTPITTSTYSVTVSDVLGCSASTSVTVTVSALPVLELGTDKTICSGASTTISTTTTGVTYLWSNTETDPSITVYPMTTTTYSLVVTNPDFCTASDVITVNVNLTPVANAGPDQSICDGSTAQLSASGGSVYVWNANPELSSTIIYNPEASPTATSSYTVAVSDNGCVSFDQVVVIVNPIPVAFAGLDDGICAGTNKLLTASGGSTYLWDYNAQTTAAITVSPTTTTTYTVTTTLNGCTDSEDVVITVNQAPTVNFGSDLIEGCEPLMINFSDSTQPAPISYLWNFGDGSTSNDFNPNHLYSDAGYYNVSLTVRSTNGCSASLLINQMINVHAQPEVDFSWNPNPGDVYNNMIGFNSLTSGGVNTWAWNFGDTAYVENTSDKENPYHTYTVAGNYPVWLYGETPFGCKDSMMHYILIKDITAFYIPNAFTPNDDNKNEKFGPVFYNYEFEQYEFMVFDRWGDMIFFTNDYTEFWDGTVAGSSTKAQLGVYVWRVKYKETKGRLTSVIGNFTLLR